MARVVKPRGRVSILELTEPRHGLLAPFARVWTRQAVPAIGALISGAREYRYLQRSIEAFPTQDRFVAMLEEAGLEPVRVRTLGLGACSLFVAERSP
jgi:demethylmenaquinone methyltransferase/2-methoxy-6-polyprenyl-1,4-benzoquinol methylase